MSELYENIKKWVLGLPDDAIVGATTNSERCIIATYLGKPLEDGWFGSVEVPSDVVDLSIEFDFLGRTVHADGLVFFPEILVTAGEARELFCEKKKEPLTKENSVVE